MSDTFKVIWYGTDATGRIHQGELPSVEEGHFIPNIELDLFKIMDERSIIKFGLRLVRDDGSGVFRFYEKVGDTWVTRFSTNLVPDWFPWFFFGILIVMFAVLALLCR